MPIDIKNSISFIDSPKGFLSSFDSQNTMLFIDENVNEHYGSEFDGFEKVIIPSGEDQKCFQSVENLLEKLLEAGIDRKGTLIGIGGGVVSDLTGFVGSIYLRGIDFGFLPTTLLAMCDASIGGKNGINFGSFKNMVGTINQPNFIAYYPQFLKTLEQREFNSGMAEVIKHAVINGGEIHEFLKNNSISKDSEKVRELCQLAAEVKVDVVEKDERESGLRKKLNLGHTIGHAIESTSDFTHGECVSIGMVLAAKISKRKEKADQGLVEEIESLCNAYSLPTKTQLNPEILLEKIVKDKKRTNQSIDFILPHAFGDVRIESMPISELKDHLNFLADE